MFEKKQTEGTTRRCESGFACCLVFIKGCFMFGGTETGVGCGLRDLRRLHAGYTGTYLECGHKLA